MKKIAIHHRPGSFSDRWITYCAKKNIPYKIVNAFDSDIVQQLSGCRALLWHHHHALYSDVMVAKKVLFALEHAGIKVFPDFKTSWHFDDKVAQKYLLEAIEAPLVPSYVFYDKETASDWAKQTSYPKVFKLKGGAGSANVRLVRTQEEARKLINIGFGKGFSQYDRFSSFFEVIRKFRNGKASFSDLVKGAGKALVLSDFAKKQPNEKGYVYFQEFMPGNNHDVRVIVIGEKAFAINRLVRENDFRASGSGSIEYERACIDEKCIRLAFEVNERIGAQCVAYDFVYDENNNPLIVEVCYGYAAKAYDACPGYWDKCLGWHEGTFNPQEWMVDLVCE